METPSATTNTSNNKNSVSALHFSRFSYSELTQLQVNGARDRSQRLKEKAEWEHKLSRANHRWNTAVESIRRKRQPYQPPPPPSTPNSNVEGVCHGSEEQMLLLQRKEEEELRLFQNAVEFALKDEGDDGDTTQPPRPTRNLSTFLLMRLAVVLRKEYHRHLLENNLDGLHREQRDLVNWVCKVVSVAEEEYTEADANRKLLIQKAKVELETARLEGILQCQHLLQLRRQEILQALNKIMEQEMKELVVVKKPCSMDNSAATAEDDVPSMPPPASTRWLEDSLDEDYFSSSASSTAPTSDAATSPSSSSDTAGNNASSDWVICGY